MKSPLETIISYMDIRLLDKFLNIFAKQEKNLPMIDQLPGDGPSLELPMCRKYVSVLSEWDGESQGIF